MEGKRPRWEEGGGGEFSYRELFGGTVRGEKVRR